MTRRIAVLSPEDLSLRKTYPAKVYLEAKLLSKFGQVTLFGYNVSSTCEYPYVELSKISKFSHSLRTSSRVYGNLISSIIKSRFDYVFIPTVFNPLFPLLFIASKLSSSTIIYDFRDSIYHTVISMKGQVLKRSGNKMLAKIVITFSSLVDKMVLRLSDYVLTTSPSLLHYAVSKGKKPVDKVFLYYNFMPEKPEKINLNDLPIQLKNGIQQGKVIIFYLGHIQPQIRGIEAAFNAILEASNKEVLMVLLGEIQEEKYWNDLVRRLEISERIFFLKARPKPQAMGLIRLFDYTILGPNNPSNVLPTKIFDCMSMGIPVIFPAHMKDVSDVVKGTGIKYRTYDELVTIIKKLTKTNKKNEQPPLNFKSMEEMIESALCKIFNSGH